VSGVFDDAAWAAMSPATPDERADLEAFFEDQVARAVVRGRERGHFYQLTADTILLQRPDVYDRYRKGLNAFPNRLRETGTEESTAVELIVTSLGHLPMYILYGWETGIYNEFRHLQGRGFTRAQLMELVLYTQLQAGIRGLQHVYNAVAKILPFFYERPEPAPFPAGWAPDPEAFRSGLDLSSRALTEADRRNVADWYERTIGYVPRTAQFAMRRHPDFFKWYRARWEIIFQTLPKQVVPYIMLRQHLLTGSTDALREAILLGKAWGVSKEWVVHGLTVSAYYTGFEGLYAVTDAVDDLLDTWT
jgi:hypothetical protein